MKGTEIPCKDVMSYVCADLGEDLNSPRCQEMRKHLETCESCGKYFKNVESTIQFYKKYNVELSDERHKRLLEKLGLSDCD